ncbi:PRKCA-binding protein, partial [Fragariocoptes setiger]
LRKAMSTRFYPRFVKGNPQLRIFLPDWTMTLIKQPNLPDNVVAFRTDPRMTDWDVKNYLTKIYKINVADIKSKIYAGDISRAPDKQYIIKADDYKIVQVTLPEGKSFKWPDLFPTERFKEELEDYKLSRTFATDTICENYNQSQHQANKHSTQFATDSTTIKHSISITNIVSTKHEGNDGKINHSIVASDAAHHRWHGALNMPIVANTPPYFQSIDSDLIVSDDNPTGTRVLVAKAVDNENDHLKYSIQRSLYNDASDYFRINPETGELVISERRFPPNSRNFYLTIAAHDGHYSSTVELRVCVVHPRELASHSMAELMATTCRPMPVSTHDKYKSFPGYDARTHRIPPYVNPPPILYPFDRVLVHKVNSGATTTTASPLTLTTVASATTSEFDNDEVDDDGELTSTESAAPVIGTWEGRLINNIVDLSMVFFFATGTIFLVLSLFVYTTLKRARSEMHRQISPQARSLNDDYRINGSNFGSTVDRSQYTDHFATHEPLSNQSSVSIIGERRLDELQFDAASKDTGVFGSKTLSRRTSDEISEFLGQNELLAMDVARVGRPQPDDDLLDDLRSANHLINRPAMNASGSDLMRLDDSLQSLNELSGDNQLLESTASIIRIDCDAHHDNNASNYMTFRNTTSQASPLICDITNNSTKKQHSAVVSNNDNSASIDWSKSMQSQEKSVMSHKTRPNPVERKHLSFNTNKNDNLEIQRTVSVPLQPPVSTRFGATAGTGNSKTLGRRSMQNSNQFQQYVTSKYQHEDSEKPKRTWGFPPHKLTFIDIIDKGQFGLVWRCEARGLNNDDDSSTKIVAVKTVKVKEGFDLDKARTDLLGEIEIMKLLGEHPNVVTLFNYCLDREPYLIMEYMERGQLQSYLRASRRDRTYDNMHGSSDTLTSRDLVKFSYHVARGMDYITSLGVVHRDLAARNILLSDQRVCKVADFGMARNVSYECAYERRSHDKVPVRWMAPESLFENKYTAKSDVYSFGILMWEIVTLGSTPYPQISATEVMALVKRGDRLAKPEHCKSDLYDIMYRCWHTDPSERPSFTELTAKLDKLLISANEYIELDQYPDHCYYNISLSDIMEHMEYIWSDYDAPNSLYFDEDKLGLSTSSGQTVITKNNSNMLGISIGGGSTSNCPCVYIVQVFDNTPASEDGTLEAGDEIVSINGISVKNKSKVDVAKMIQTGGKDVTINYNKLHVDTEQGKSLDIILKKFKHRMVEKMSPTTADTIGLSRAILCNDSLVKRMQELHRNERIYAGLRDRSRNNFKTLYEMSRVYRAFGDVLTEIGCREKQPEAGEAFRKFGECNRIFEKFGFETLEKMRPIIKDLDTYLNKAIPDTKLTIKKYADAKFEYLSYCLKIKEMDDEERDFYIMNEPLYRVETGNYEYRLILRCRQVARARFSSLRSDVLAKIELLDQKHVQHLAVQLSKIMQGLSEYNGRCSELLAQCPTFPIEMDLSQCFDFTYDDVPEQIDSNNLDGTEELMVTNHNDTNEQSQLSSYTTVDNKNATEGQHCSAVIDTQLKDVDKFFENNNANTFENYNLVELETGSETTADGASLDFLNDLFPRDNDRHSTGTATSERTSSNDLVDLTQDSQVKLHNSQRRPTQPDLPRWLAGPS